MIFKKFICSSTIALVVSCSPAIDEDENADTQTSNPDVPRESMPLEYCGFSEEACSREGCNYRLIGRVGVIEDGVCTVEPDRERTICFDEPEGYSRVVGNAFATYVRPREGEQGVYDAMTLRVTLSRPPVGWYECGSLEAADANCGSFACGRE